MSTDGPIANRHPRDVKILLQAEGLVVVVLAVAAYAALGGSWWLFVLLILAPDLAFLGLLAGPRFGVYCYNAVHTYAMPLAIGFVAYLAGQIAVVPFMLIWVAHIGADRMIGYGLKYPGAPEQTHLGPMGRKKG